MALFHKCSNYAEELGSISATLSSPPALVPPREGSSTGSFPEKAADNRAYGRVLEQVIGSSIQLHKRKDIMN